MDDGVVPGGGVTLVELAESLKPTNKDPNISAKAILANALYKPFIQLHENAGLDGVAQLLLLLNHKAKMEEEKTGSSKGVGIDVNDSVGNVGHFVPMKERGIIDPTRVAKEAIQNAVSIAGTAMTM